VSSFSDALKALKTIVVMHERIDRLESDVDAIGQDVRGLSVMCHDLDKRLYALERIIDIGAQQARNKRIEEQ
jgi:hypothetical protein